MKNYTIKIERKDGSYYIDSFMDLGYTEAMAKTVNIIYGTPSLRNCVRSILIMEI